jgi:hypothetical protein
MDVRDVLTALREERTQIEEVIANLERLELSRERNRHPLSPEPKKRGRPRGSKNRPSERSMAAAAGAGETIAIRL